MSRVVHKRELGDLIHQEIVLPGTAEVLTVQLQRGISCLWYVFDDADVTRYAVDVWIIPTGRAVDLPVYARHVATYQDLEGLVFHVFTAAASSAPERLG